MDQFIYETYDYLHSIAEVGYKEVRTSAFLADQLKSMGYKVNEKVGTTGIVAELDSGLPGKTLGFRADMDALPFKEDNKEIAIHACGHDANMAMVLTTAKTCAERGLKSGNLFIVFQQAEELVGAVEMAHTEIMKTVPVLIGTHMRPIAEARMGQAISAMHTGAAYFLNIVIEGKLAHGARAHQGVNAIEVAAQLITAINSIREDVTIPHSIKVTQIESSGNSKNTIPNQCRIVFDLRAQNNIVADSLIEKTQKLATAICEMNGATLKDIEMNGVPAAEIDTELYELCDQAIVDVLGQSLGRYYTVGGEDIHHFKRINDTRIGYIGIGCDMSGNLHGKDMSFNRKALETGTKIQVKIIENTLGLN